MNKSWKVILAFAVVFLAGGACGWVLTLRFAHPQVAPRAVNRPADFGVQLMMRWVRFNQLDLSDEQKEVIRPLVSTAAEQLRRLQRDDRHNAQLIIERMQDAIAAELTPGQRNRFDDLIRAQRQKLNRFIQQQQWQRAMQAPPREGPANGSVP